MHPEGLALNRKQRREYSTGGYEAYAEFHHSELKYVRPAKGLTYVLMRKLKNDAKLIPNAPVHVAKASFSKPTPVESKKMASPLPTPVVQIVQKKKEVIKNSCLRDSFNNIDDFSDSDKLIVDFKQLHHDVMHQTVLSSEEQPLWVDYTKSSDKWVKKIDPEIRHAIDPEGVITESDDLLDILEECLAKQAADEDLLKSDEFDVSQNVDETDDILGSLPSEKVDKMCPSDEEVNINLDVHDSSVEDKTDVISEQEISIEISPVVESDNSKALVVLEPAEIIHEILKPNPVSTWFASVFDGFGDKLFQNCSVALNSLPLPKFSHNLFVDRKVWKVGPLERRVKTNFVTRETVYADNSDRRALIHINADLREADSKLVLMAMGRRDSLYFLGYELWNYDLKVVSDLMVSLELMAQGMASTNADLRLADDVVYDKIYYTIGKCAQVNLDKTLIVAGHNVCVDTALYCLAKWQDNKHRRRHFCPPLLKGVSSPMAIEQRK
jgi:hypothetical protein